MEQWHSVHSGLGCACSPACISFQEAVEQVRQRRRGAVPQRMRVHQAEERREVEQLEQHCAIDQGLQKHKGGFDTAHMSIQNKIKTPVGPRDGRTEQHGYDMAREGWQPQPDAGPSRSSGSGTWSGWVDGVSEAEVGDWV